MAITSRQIGRGRGARQTGMPAMCSRLGRAALLACALAVSLAACAQPAPGAQASADRAVGGPFTLVDQDGRPVDQRVLNGKWSIVFFGYTFCPDFCPTTLTALGQTMTLLGPKAQDMQVVFITVDPERDTPRQLKTYLSSRVFPRNIIGLTGTPDQVAQAAREYDVYYRKDGSGPNYTVDHSTVLYLMDPTARFRGPLADGETPQQQAQEIVRAMDGAPA